MIAPLPAEVSERLRSGVAITSVAQCVEELVHNSLDAKATCIAVRLDLSIGKIQVVDNGEGIPQDQLEHIGKRYHTSKCHSKEDLSQLHHFGYRGEALASIRDICCILEVESRHKLSTQTYTCAFQSGDMIETKKSSDHRPSVGTTITVYDLFNKLPVRKKNLSESLDLERVRRRIEAIALMHPQISFSLRNDITGHRILQSHKSNSVLSVFRNLFSSQKARVLGEISGQLSDFHITGYVGKEGHSNNQLQFVYVNQRVILKSKIHKLINFYLSKSTVCRRQAASPVKSGQVSPSRFYSRYGMYIINITCPYTEYDITFDPAKTLVEFKDWKPVIACMQMALVNFLEEEGLLLQPASDISGFQFTKVSEMLGGRGTGQSKSADSADSASQTVGAGKTYGLNISADDLNNACRSVAVHRPVHQPSATKITRASVDIQPVHVESVREVIPGAVLTSGLDASSQGSDDTVLGKDAGKTDDAAAVITITSGESTPELGAGDTRVSRKILTLKNPHIGGGDSGFSHQKQENLPQDVINQDDVKTGKVILGHTFMSQEFSSSSLLTPAQRETSVVLTQEQTLEYSGDPLLKTDGITSLASKLHGSVNNQQHQMTENIKSGPSTNKTALSVANDNQTPPNRNFVSDQQNTKPGLSQSSYKILSMGAPCPDQDKLKTSSLQQFKQHLAEKKGPSPLLKGLERLRAKFGRPQLRKLSITDVKPASSPAAAAATSSIHVAAETALDFPAQHPEPKRSESADGDQEIMDVTAATSRIQDEFSVSQNISSASPLMSCPTTKSVSNNDLSAYSVSCKEGSMEYSYTNSAEVPVEAEDLVDTRKRAHDLDTVESVIEQKLPKISQVFSSCNEFPSGSELLFSELQTISTDLATSRITEKEYPELCALNFQKKYDLRNRPGDDNRSEPMLLAAEPLSSGRTKEFLSTSNLVQTAQDIMDVQENSPSTAIANTGSSSTEQNSPEDSNQSSNAAFEIFTSSKDVVSSIFMTTSTIESPNTAPKQLQNLPLLGQVALGQRVQQSVFSEDTADSDNDVMFCSITRTDSKSQLLQPEVSASDSSLSFADNNNGSLKGSSGVQSLDSMDEEQDPFNFGIDDTIQTAGCKGLYELKSPTKVPEQASGLDMKLKYMECFQPVTARRSDEAVTEEVTVVLSSEKSSPSSGKSNLSLEGQPEDEPTDKMCLGSSENQKSNTSAVSGHDSLGSKNSSNEDDVFLKIVRTEGAYESPVADLSVQNGMQQEVTGSPCEEAGSADAHLSFTVYQSCFANKHLPAHVTASESPIVDLSPSVSSPDSLAGPELARVHLGSSPGLAGCRKLSAAPKNTLPFQAYKQGWSSTTTSCRHCTSVAGSCGVCATTSAVSKLPQSTSAVEEHISMFPSADTGPSAAECQVTSADAVIDDVNNQVEMLPSADTASDASPAPSLISSEGFDCDVGTSQRFNSKEMDTEMATQEFCVHSKEPSLDKKGRKIRVGIPSHQSVLREEARLRTLSEDMKSIGGSWVCKTNTNSDKPVYINLATGYSTYQKPQVDADAQEKTQSSAEPKPQHPFLSHDCESLMPRPVCERHQDIPDDCGTEEGPVSPPVLQEMLHEHQQEEERDAMVKWRHPQEMLDNFENDDDESDVISQLMKQWVNPVADTKDTNVKSTKGPMVSESNCLKEAYLQHHRFTKDMLKDIQVLGQIDRKFLACLVKEDGSCTRDPSLLVFVDQHAAHERVRLEQLVEEAYETVQGIKKVKTYDLSPSIEVTLTQEEVRIAQAFRQKVQEKGLTFTCDADRRDVLLVHTAPICFMERKARETRSGPRFAETAVKAMLKDIVENIQMTHGVSSGLPRMMHNVLSTQACRGAIKFGDSLSMAEAQSLLESLSLCELPFQCAHGRPSIVPIADMHNIRTSNNQEESRPNLRSLKMKMRKRRT